MPVANNSGNKESMWVDFELSPQQEETIRALGQNTKLRENS